MKIKIVVFILIFLLCYCNFIVSQQDDDFDDEEFEGSDIQDASDDEIIEEEILEEEFQEIQEYDEEEFEGFEEIKPQKKKDKPKKSAFEEKNVQEKKEENPTENKEFKITDYGLETGYVAFILFYVVFYLWGRSKNSKIAHNWYKTYNSLILDMFGQVPSFEKLSNQIYTISSHGKQSCIGGHITLELKKRYDAFSTIVDFFSGSSSDKLIIDIALNNSVEDFVFAVIKKKNEKTFRTENEDIKAYTNLVSSSLPTQQFSVFSEVEEFVDIFLTQEVVKTLKTYENQIISLHFSDSHSVSTKYKKVLHFEFLLSNPEKMNTLMKMIKHFLELVEKLKFSPKIKTKLGKNRSQVKQKQFKNSHQERQELAQERKAEKIRKEKEAIQNMSGEAQRKAEERFKKKEDRRRMGSKMKMSKVVM